MESMLSKSAWYVIVEMLNDRSTVHEFINLTKLLAFPGELTESTSIGKLSNYIL